MPPTSIPHSGFPYLPRRRKPLNPDPLISHLTNSNGCGNLTLGSMNVSPLGTPLLSGPKVYPHLLFLPSYPPLCHAFIFINLQIRSLACPPTQPFIFIYLQIPFPANPLDSHPYKIPGCHPTHPFHPRAQCPVFPLSLSQISCFQQLADSLFSLCALFDTSSLCFQYFPDSFAKTPGGGGLLRFSDTRSPQHRILYIHNVLGRRHTTKGFLKGW
jgi:hypothetical protein